MKFIITPNEYNASIKLIKAVISNIPRTIMGAEERTKFYAMMEDYQSCNASGFDAAVVEEFNKNHMESNKCFTCQLTTDGTMVLEVFEDKVVEVTDIITDEIDTLAGIIVTMVGMFMTFGSRLKKMAEKITAVANR